MKRIYVFLVLMLSCIYSVRTYAQNRDEDPVIEEGSYLNIRNDDQNPCISSDQYDRIQKRCELNTREIESKGRIQKNGAMVQLLWPLRASVGLHDCSYYFVSAYVDQNTASGSITDYNCGTNTYDGHHGTDIATWPFYFYKMDHDQVEVIATAAGTIIDKGDGNFDRSCGSNALPANYVIIQHADGSRVLYWHMKKNSVTSKSIGQTVLAGEYLGVVGSSGSSSGPHLHFEVWSGSTSATYQDPYTGTCNTLNASSWWASQKPYTEPGIVKASLHTTDIVFPPCPETETLNESTSFPLDFAGPELPVGYAKFYIFIRNETTGMQANMRILNPDGSTLSSWVYNSTGNNKIAIRAWTKLLPKTIGMYTFETTYNGTTCSQLFEMTNPTSLAESEVSSSWKVFPNPSDGKLIFELKNEGSPIPKGIIEIYNPLGEIVCKSFIRSSSSEFELDLPRGVFYYRVMDEKQLFSAGKLVIQ